MISMSVGEKVTDFLFYVSQTGVFSYKPNHYKIRSMKQESLISFFQYLQRTTMLRPLIEGNIDEVNAKLISNLKPYAVEMRNWFDEKFSSGMTQKRFDSICRIRKISIYSAFLEANSHSYTETLFNKLREGNEKEEIPKIMTWSEYREKGYDNFFRSIKEYLPTGPHSELYNARVQAKIAKEKKAKDSNNKLLNDAKELAEKKKSTKVQKPIETKSTAKRTSEESKNLPVEPVISPKVSAKTESSVDQNEPTESKNVSVPAHVPPQPSRPSPAPRPKPKDSAVSKPAQNLNLSLSLTRT